MAAEAKKISPSLFVNGGCKRRKCSDENGIWPSDDELRAVDLRKFIFLNDHICRLSGGSTTMATRLDDLHYSQAWFTHYKRREAMFKPWYPTLDGEQKGWEVLRIQAVKSFWEAARSSKISPVTVHLAVWILNKILYTLRDRLDNETFAGVVAVGLRTALKFEERPEALWGIRRIWEVLPMFDNWQIDRSDQYLMKVEAETLRIVNDCLDVPLPVQFFDKYIMVGGWPQELVKDYSALGHFLLALTTFATGESHPLTNIMPSKLAAAAVVLSIKIVNGDSHRCYEFFPQRFAAFTQMSFPELQPAIKGLSLMLRRKPEEAAILGKLYPGWGEHEWQ